MNRWLLAVAWMTTALAGVLAMPAHAADEIQVVRKDAPAGSTLMLPFTTYQREVQSIMQDLPCKWVSMDGRLGPSYGSGRYDFLCKGGDWATVSLFLDKSNTDGVGRVRLLYREWKDNIHPNAGEAYVAQQFLQHVLSHFIPAHDAGDVMEAFWRDSSRDWSGNGVKVSFKLDAREAYAIRILDIQGTAHTLAEQPVVVAPRPGTTAKPVPVARPMTVDVVPQPVVTPTDAGLRKETVEEPVALPAEPAVVLPQAPVSLPVPQDTGLSVVPPVQTLQVPANAPAAQVTSTLIQATPAELNTAPAPESLKKPEPLPAVSPSLVPTTGAAIDTRQKAPSNFDAYNRAEELTRDLEKKAMIAPPDKIKSAQQAKQQAEKAAQATASKPVAEPKPEVPVGLPHEPNEETGLPPDTTPYVPGQPNTIRPLPQLKFIPKAEPLTSPDETIEFEDEKSTL